MKDSFPYVAATSDLPPLGEREGLLVDFKGRVVKDDAFERGKDISAFANSSGGVLLVGAAEDTTRGILTRWLPFTDQEAQTVVRDYTNVAKDTCSPEPFIIPKPIALADGSGFVVAINVRPHVTGEAVLVRIAQTDTWGCFRRIGDQNLAVDPPELPMLMLPKLRRAVLLLRRIPDPKLVKVYVANPNGGTYNTDGGLDAIDEERNFFLLKARDGATTFPLDAVESAYPMANGSRWIILLSGACPVVPPFRPPP